MTIERELLNEVLEYFDPLGLNTEHCGDLPERIKELLAQPEQEQQPVAWMWKKHTAGGWLDVVSIDKPTANAHQINIQPLYYTEPAKRKPLSDEAICKILLKKEWKGFVELVRIIEKAHGIGGGE